jgi:hypothetical protein
LKTLLQKFGANRIIRYLCREKINQPVQKFV